jgi:ferredoxin
MKIIQERKKCIGCGACAAACPKYWEMAEDGPAKLKGGKINPKTGNDELEVKNIDCNKEAAEACPVQIIKISSK